MTSEHLHTVVVAGVIVAALVILKLGNARATPSGVTIIQEARTTAASAYTNLPDYLNYNVQAWGPRMQPLISMPNSGGVTNAYTAAPDEQYGAFYSN